MRERRKIKRKYLMFYTRVFDAESSTLIGHLLDITAAGCMLISEAPVPTGQDFQLKMELSPDVTERPFLQFEARSLWCRQDVNPQFYNTGFQFIAIAPDDLHVIERIVEAYGFRDN